VKCPAGCFHGHAGYDRRGRPIPCRKCRGTGRITPTEPQRPPWLQTRDLRCSCGRTLAEHERPCMGDEIRASECSAIGDGLGVIISGSLQPAHVLIPDLLP
jgi:hypothetical protein